MTTNNLNVSVLNIPAHIFKQMWDATLKNAPVKFDMDPSETIDIDWNDLPDNGQKIAGESLVALIVSAAFIQYEKQHGK